MKLIKQGSTVQVVGESIKAKVIGVCARGEYAIEYEISWWINGDRKTTWLNDFEIEPFRDNSKKPGFHPVNSKPQKSIGL